MVSATSSGDTQIEACRPREVVRTSSQRQESSSLSQNQLISLAIDERRSPMPKASVRRPSTACLTFSGSLAAALSRAPRPAASSPSFSAICPRRSASSSQNDVSLISGLILTFISPAFRPSPSPNSRIRALASQSKSLSTMPDSSCVCGSRAASITAEISWYSPSCSSGSRRVIWLLSTESIPARLPDGTRREICCIRPVRLVFAERAPVAASSRWWASSITSLENWGSMAVVS